MTPTWWKLRPSREALHTVGRRTASIAAGVAVLLAARGALAEAPRPKLVEGDVTLDYRRGPGTAACPDEAALRERAADSFDFRDPFVARGQAASAHMRIEIERAGAAYQGKVLLLDDAGATFAASTEEHGDCDALVWLLGHRVALAILRRPSAAVAPPAPSPEPGPDVVRIPVPLPPPTIACDARCAAQIASAGGVRPAPPREPALSFAAGGLVTAGSTADVGPGAWLAASAREGALSLGLELRSAFPARVATYGATLTSSLASVSAAVVPCAHWKLVAGCVFAEVGAQLFLVPRSDTPIVPDALVSLGPRLALDVPLGAGLSVRAFADLALRPYLPVFTVQLRSASDTDVRRWSTPLLTGLFGLGVAWSR